MTPAFERAIKTRIRVIEETPEVNRKKFAQHLTPPEVAMLAVSMFSDSKTDIKCLDLGGGTGILSIAVLERFGRQVKELDTIEIDSSLAAIYDKETRKRVKGKTIIGDALTDSILKEKKYNRVILNPPYRKMAANDYRQALLPVRSPNLYSAFVMAAIEHLSEDGELVAIIPRSWMNGEYFIPFRHYVIGECSIDAIHVYGSREEVFSDTSVLQETIIIRLSKRMKGQTPTIRVSHSAGKGDTVNKNNYPANSLIIGENKIVRVVPQDQNTLAAHTIEEVGLCPSTGKVVDFRSRNYIYEEAPSEKNAVPLIYVSNFPKGKLEHPLSFGKGQWFALDDDWAKKQVCEPGAYVLVKRFSAKEEPRRVVAYPLVIDEPVALENHTTFLHQGTSHKVIPLRSDSLAYGLTIWLNSTFIDKWFRGVSGSTQVNAGDIKIMPCPQLTELETLGESWHVDMTQDEIDQICMRGL